MPKMAASTTRPIRALLLGLSAAAALAAVHIADLDRPLERQTLDVRFRRARTAPAPAGVVHVDIDDTSLEKFGRWPWPRQQLAGLIQVLLDCNARAVALDIVLPDPQQLRYEPAPYAAILATDGNLRQAPPRPVFDDRVLAATIGPNRQRIVLGMYIQSHAGDLRSPGERLIASRVAADPRQSADHLREQLLQRADFAEDPAAQELAFRRAYLRAQAMVAIRPLGMVPNVAGQYPLPKGLAVPPMVLFARSLGRIAFVNPRRDSDGVVRRMPLLMQADDRVYPQLALELAGSMLAGDTGRPARISASRNAVHIEVDGQIVRTIPVDAEGCMTINWSRRIAPSQRIPAGAALLAWQARQDLDALARCRRTLVLQIAKAVFDPQGSDQRGLQNRHMLFRSCIDAEDLRQQLQARQEAWAQAELLDPAHAPPGLDALQRRYRELESTIDAQCDSVLAELSDPDALDLYLDPSRPALRAAVVRDLAEVQRVAQKRAETLAILQDRLREVRDRVAGKVCMVGSTATGAPDFVVTPIDETTPGVEVHTNVLNTIVTGLFIRRADLVTETLVILLLGAMVTVAASWRNSLEAGLLTLVLGTGYALLNAFVVFAYWHVWLAMAAPLLGMFLSFTVVTAFRQLTEERARRAIRSMFAQNLSPVLVDEMLRDPSLLTLGGERRVLSCFFSDLAGFTPLSERLGEQATVRVLNHYFDHMTEVLQDRNRGYVNKFLGDGLFVLFGAPVRMSDHPSRAIQAALDCHREIEVFNREIREQAPDAPALSCRVGVATGDVMVGNCGSTSRADYSAIGPTVNLASRLESANKFFGTRTLVDGATWRLAELDDVIALPMGRIVVVGTSEPVEVFSPIARDGSTDGELHKLVERFTAALRQFRNREFAAAAEAFDAVSREHADDKASAVYRDLARQFAEHPPGDEWRGEIVLTEK